MFESPHQLQQTSRAATVLGVFVFYKAGNNQNLLSLLYTDTIYSVTIDGATYTDASQWLSYLSFDLSKNDSGNVLTINLTSLGQNKTIKFVVRRNYSGGNEQGQLSVVGGIIDYTFILNDNSQNHTIRIVDNDEKVVLNNYIAL